MALLTIGAQAGLLIWFFGCIRTYRFGRYILVEGMGIKSAEFIMLCLYAAGIALSLALPAAGRWYLLGVLILWLAIQFFCHWYYTIFGASERKRKGYNECFQNTVHLIPASATRVIPDLYHIILHILILLNIILTICSIAS